MVRTVDTRGHKITVPSDSELALLIKSAASKGESVLVDTGDETYRLNVSAEAVPSSTSAGSPAKGLPSAEEVARSREGTLKSAGSWKDIDAQALKAYIRARRRASSRRRLGQ